MKLPSARGPLSAAVVEVLSGGGHMARDRAVRLVGALPADTDLLADDDLHLSLWLLFEQHYQGFEGVAEELEWDPDLLALRRELERIFEAELRRVTAGRVSEAVEADGDVAERLFALTEAFDGPSVAAYLQREATLEQYREFLVHRSVYHLKESDPSSFVIPRLTGKPKAALVELQYDEYGGGRPDRIHSTLFGDALEAAGLDRGYSAYVDRVPGYTLAVNNAMSLLGLNRRLRAAAMGHLGAFEATSSLPCRKLAGGARRLELPEPVAAYFDEHVEADAVHEQLAFRDICAELARQDPQLLVDVFFGAAVCLALDTMVAERMVPAWRAGESTLRPGPDVVDGPRVEAVA
ncbi:MAG TPA: iron-containing redox enzyme family protein [Nocardioidaceae bacterium]|jgi:hypothetical protein